MLRKAYSAIPRYRPGPARAARTWLESESGSNTSSVPRINTAREPPSTKKAARGSRRAMTFLAAYREVVIQSEPAAKLYAAGLTSGRRAERSASMPIWARPRIASASRLKRTTPTLGRSRFEGVPDAVHRALQPLLDQRLQAPGHQRARHRGRRHVRDAQLHAHPIRHLGERESALLLDEPGLRLPADLVRAAPAVQPQHAAQWKAHGDELDVVAGADPGRAGADWLPPRHALEHPRDVSMVGEVVEGTLRRRVDDHRRRELEAGHSTKISACAGPMDGFGSRTRWRARTPSARKSSASSS